MVWEPDKVYEDLRLIGDRWDKLICPNIKIKTSDLKHVDLSAARLDKLRLEEDKFRECNLANLEADECNWWKSELVECKLTGMRLVKPIWEKVTVNKSNGQYLQLRFGKVKQSRFYQTDLRWSDFQETDLSGCEFRDCLLGEADFSGAKLKGTDLRGCDLTQIRIGVAEIKGAIVTTAQALYLSGLLGIEIRD